MVPFEPLIAVHPSSSRTSTSSTTTSSRTSTSSTTTSSRTSTSSTTATINLSGLSSAINDVTNTVIQYLYYFILITIPLGLLKYITDNAESTFIRISATLG